MQTPPPPTAQGLFAKTPFPHLLVYALEQRLSGSFELHVGSDRAATLLVVEGFPAKVCTEERVHTLGDVMLELGLATSEQVAAARARVDQAPALLGQALLEAGVAPAALEGGLHAQMDRKIEHLFALPPETAFAYYDGFDALAAYGGPPLPHDPFAVLWRGVRQSPSWEHVDATLRRVGGLAVRIAPRAELDRFQFARAEAAAIELLQQRAMRVVDVAASKVVGPSLAQLLVYCLVITKQVDLVEPGSARPPALKVPLAGPPSQQVARVQLQARPVQRVPMVVEELTQPTPGDPRFSSPMPGAAVAPVDVAVGPHAPPPAFSESEGAPPAAGSSADIGAMIHATIQSSMPPPAPSSVPALEPPEPIAPATAPPVTSPSGQMPAVPAPLTLEQNALKAKILERAAAISAQDYFQMLGLDREASIETVQKTFLQLAKVWHPDRLPAALFDVKDAATKIFAHLTEAHATLTDPQRRQGYMTLLKDGGATPDDQAKIQAVLEAATEFQKAEFLLKRNDVDKAYELVSRARSLDPEQADYLALLTWLEAQRPEWLGREKTLEKIAVLDRCVKMNPHCHRALFWRGMLYKRIDEPRKAVADFRRVSDLDPRNLDAQREVRLYNMRGGTKPPPALAPQSTRPSKPPQPEKLGLFGKLFKK